MTGDGKNRSTELLEKKVDILLKLRGYRRVGEEEKVDGSTDITVLQRRTRKKLLIRVVTQSKLSSGSIGVRRIRILKRNLEKMNVDGILIGSGRFTPSARSEARKKGIEFISAEDLLPFDIFKHKLVPKHEILSEDEVQKLLKKYHIKPWQLPWIKASDPAARMIGAKPGDVLKITRKSPTAGKAIAYRQVIGRGV